jgi:allophanate hydrolase subunit 2
MEASPQSVSIMPPKPPTIHVLRPGLFTTMQDLGRNGYQRFGVSVSGAMDPWALTVGNRLLGNPDRAAGLEITIQGPELLFTEELAIVITGADLSPTSNGLARSDVDRGRACRLEAACSSGCVDKALEPISPWPAVSTVR